MKTERAKEPEIAAIQRRLSYKKFALFGICLHASVRSIQHMGFGIWEAREVMGTGATKRAESDTTARGQEALNARRA